MVYATIDFKNLGVEVVIGEGKCCKKGGEVTKKHILQGVSGQLKHGDIAALMGPSGAGKSTLLNVLSRRNRNNEGEILVNGEDADKSPIMEYNSCYIQQEDLFFTTLTVHEHLCSQAALRLALPKTKRLARVNDVTKMFGMTKTLDSPIGGIKSGGKKGISGGEMKRLSVATELLANSSIVFADEPTSGLDSSMAEHVVQVLSDLAAQGHTVICTIHQPSTDVFKLFNKLILVSEGQMVYCGPRLGAEVYLARYGLVCPPFQNPADYFLEALAINWEDPTDQLAALSKLYANWIEHGESFITEWESGGLKEKMALLDQTAMEHHEIDHGIDFEAPTNKDGSPKTVASYRKLFVLLDRSWTQTMRDPSLFVSALMVAIITAFAGGVLYFRLPDTEWFSKAGAMFFLLINQSFPSMNMVLTSFTESKPISRREKESGLYGAFMAFWVQAVVDLFRLTLNPIVFVLISWFMMGLGDDFPSFFFGALAVWCCSLAISGFGYIVAAAAPSAGVAFSLGPLIVLPLLFTAGFVLSLNSIPSFWLWLVYSSPLQYSFAAMMEVVYEGVDFCDQTDELICSGEDLIDLFSSGLPYWVCIGACLAIAILTRFIGAIALMVAFRKKENE